MGLSGEIWKKSAKSMVHDSSNFLVEKLTWQLTYTIAGGYFAPMLAGADISLKLPKVGEIARIKIPGIYTIEVIGNRNISGPAILLPPHSYNFDPFFNGVAFKKYVNPVYEVQEGFDLTTEMGIFAGGFGVYRKGDSFDLKPSERRRIVDRLTEGGIILSFQEGETNSDFVVHRGKPSIVDLGMIVERTKNIDIAYYEVGIIVDETPEAVHNPFRKVLTKTLLGTTSPPSGAHITVIIGDPHYSNARNFTDKNALRARSQELTDIVMSGSARLSGRPYAGKPL